MIHLLQERLSPARRRGLVFSALCLAVPAIGSAEWVDDHHHRYAPPNDHPFAAEIEQFQLDLFSQTHPVTQWALIRPDPHFCRPVYIQLETDHLDCSLSISEPWIPQLLAGSPDRYTTD